MKNKIIRSANLLLFIFFLLSIPLGYVLMNAYAFNICYFNELTSIRDVSCSQDMKGLGSALFYIGLAGIGITAAFILFPQALREWLKFGVWATPLYLFLQYDSATHFQSGTFLPSGSDFLRYDTALYLGASVGIIALSYILHRTKKQLPKFIKITLFILAAIAGAAIMWHLINPLIDGIELLMQQIFGR